jgi:hypothetical protein
MLTAESAELAPQGSGDLAEHLRACDACAAAARALGSAMRRLAADLEPAPAGTPVRAAGARTAAARRDRIGMAALAAAAAVTLLLVRSSAPIPEPVAPELPAGPIVEVPPGHNAVVFRTADPDITVVWYY